MSEQLEPHVVEYRAYLATPKWQTKRLLALDRAGHRCQVCNSTERLDVHHRTYANIFEELPEDLTVLCRHCHDLYEAAKRAAKLGKPAPAPPKPKSAKAAKKSKKSKRNRSRRSAAVEQPDWPRTLPAFLKAQPGAGIADVAARYRIGPPEAQRRLEALLKVSPPPIKKIGHGWYALDRDGRPMHRSTKPPKPRRTRW